MEIKEFKDDLFDAVWRHGKNLFVPMLVLNVISSAVLLGILIPVFLGFFPVDVITKFTVIFQPQNMSNQEELILFLQEFMMDHLPQMLTFIFIAIVVSILASSWVCRVGYSVSWERLEGEKNWVSLIGKSFDRTLIQTIKGVLVIMVLYLVVFFAAMGITVVLSMIGLPQILLLFIVMIFVIAFLVRMILMLPGIVIGNMSVRESLSFSWKHINTSRAFKLMGIAIVAIIAIFIILIIISLIANLILGAQSTANTIFSVISNVFINAIFYALAIAGSAGLFYRYGNFEGADENSSPEDHLVTGE